MTFSAPPSLGPRVTAAGVSRRDAGFLFVLIAGAVTAMIGGLMIAWGSAGLLPPGPGSDLVPPILLGLGGVGALTIALVRRRRLLSTVEVSVPRLYPFAPVGIHLAIYLLLLLGAASVFASGFYSSVLALDSANDVGLPQAPVTDALVIAGSLVIWLLALYTVLVVARCIRLGRAVDSPGVRDVYGRPLPSPPPEPKRAGKLQPSPPVPTFARSFLFATTTVCLFGMSATIQLAVVGATQASATDWLWAQLLTLLWAALVAAGIGMADRAIRNLEQDYLRLRFSARPSSRALAVG